ncbi:hypothetical protein D3C73_1398440 [compost metagenome]
MVTHDLKTALRGNRVLYLRDGVMVGELLLPSFKEAGGMQRLEQLQSFLTEMGW